MVAKRGRLVVISGPSAGVGKDTIIQMFRQKYSKWHEPPSVTTRPPRAGEVEGKHYYFVDKLTFKDKIKNGEFLEWEETTDHFYGTLKKPVEELLAAGKDVIIRKDVRGALSIKKVLPEATIICLIPNDWKFLEKRFRARATDSEELIQQRMKLARQELKFKDQFDYVITNPHNQPQKALAEVEKVISS